MSPLLGGLGAAGRVLNAGVDSYRGMEDARKAEALRQILQLQLATAKDERNASLGGIYGGMSGQPIDPTMATLMALSGNPTGQPSAPSMPSMPPPASAGTPVGAPSYQDPSGFAPAPIAPASGAPQVSPVPTQTGPTPSPAPLGGPSPAPQAAQGGMPSFGGAQMSLGQMFQRLRADPRNKGIPDNVLLGMAVKVQQAIYPADRMLLNFLIGQQRNNTTMRGQNMRAEASARTDDTRRRGQDMTQQWRDFMTKGTLTPETANMVAARALAGDTTAFQGLGSGILGAANWALVYKAMQDQGASGGDLARATLAFRGSQAAIKSVETQGAKIDVAANEMKEFGPLVIQSSEKIDRTKYPTMNKAYEAWLSGTGDEEIIRLMDSVNALQNAYAQVVTRGGQSTEGARDKAEEVLSAAWSKGQIKTGIDQLMKEAEAAMRATSRASGNILNRTGSSAPPRSESSSPSDTSDPLGIR